MTQLDVRRPEWIAPFLGGVAAAAPARALLPDATGHAVLVDLAHGRRLWRSAAPMRPLALNGELAFGLMLGPARVVALDTASGVERWSSAPLPWPLWASSTAQVGGVVGASDVLAGWAARATRDMGDQGDKGDLAGARDDGDAPESGDKDHAHADLLLVWQLRRPAAGMQRDLPPDHETGACRIARSDGSIMLLDDAPALADDAAKRAARAEHIESLDPCVLAQQRFHGMRYALALRPAGAAAGAARMLVLEAWPDPRSDRVVANDPASQSGSEATAEPANATARGALWQCLLDDSPVPRRTPKPLPPRH